MIIGTEGCVARAAIAPNEIAAAPEVRKNAVTTLLRQRVILASRDYPLIPTQSSQVACW